MANFDGNKELVLRFMQAIVDGDVATLETIIHYDARWWINGIGDLDRAGLFNGLSALIAAKERTMVVTHAVAEGDHVAVEAVGEMVYDNDVYRNQYHNVFRIADGCIIEGREYMDTQAAAAFMARR
ncbi:nuclear transport factor 2 family protein [Sphingobium sp. CECT 9361]|uniref:nuclear transport factor 2 family protein n=1 Tax=Sphingobium sp. CECT 9361 TaxID=2845384 RepID=UPI001E5BB0F2|nr:nuclear transport factor 2 family protein [Sphingobium sp. CECT 9361]CAH0356867.1 hypothetical protein SPH9361_04513 [Sphingobium sp. CECT 9361]